MRKSFIKTALYIISLFVAAGCDTTEDALWVGEKPQNVFKVTGPITLNADGTAVALELNSICDWTASIEDNENNFDVSPSSGKGNMTVQVTSSPNYNSKRQQTCKLIFKATELDEQVSVDVTQAALLLEMEQKDITVPESGENISLDFTSTVGWVFETWPSGSTPLKDTDWLKFDPGFSGDGDYRKIQLTVDILPNYTPSERIITLGLNPQNSEVANQISSLPAEFSIIQAAGTLSTISNADTVFVARNEIGYKFDYDSKSPVEDYGVKVLSEDGSELKSVSAKDGNGDLAISGTANVRIDNLNEGTVYGIQPYVTNKVGKTLDTVINMVRTKSTLIGASIKNYNVTPSSKSVTVLVNVESDAVLNEVGIKIFPVGSSANSIAEKSVPLTGSQLQFEGEISSENTLTPNTGYNLVIYVRSVVNEIPSDPIPFRTTGLIPGEDDNNRPDVQQ